MRFFVISLCGGVWIRFGFVVRFFLCSTFVYVLYIMFELEKIIIVLILFIINGLIVLLRSFD